MAAESATVVGASDIVRLTSLPVLVELRDRASQPWGRHGFDGSDCGKEAYRSACIRNRVQKHNCHTTNGIRSLIS